MMMMRSNENILNKNKKFHSQKNKTKRKEAMTFIICFIYERYCCVCL